MTKNFNTKIILHKIETTEGTDATPTGAADAILVYDFSENFLQATENEKPYEREYYGSRPTSIDQLQRGATFKVPLAGAGAATTAPAWMKLNRPGGMDAGVVGASSVVQSPITSAIPSATQWYSLGGEVAKTIGSRATVGINFEDGQDPYFEYTYLGRAATPLASDTSISGVDTSDFIDSIVANSENTIIQLDSYAPPVRSLSLNSGSQLEFRSLIGPQDRVLYAERGWTGQIVIEAPSLSAKDYYAKVLSRATMPLSVVHGTVAGAIVEISAPAIQLGTPSRDGEQGALMLTLPFRVLPNTGNDEIIITSK